ncbi:hypothetical protein HYT60_01280 [Candidatus Woesebacteria bacterium]|nr:hypothetical protein [Candidatus Woesebacteria bacterium]
MNKKSNKLTIQLDKPVRKVFAFTINAKNTPLWIDSIVKEETSEWPVKVGSVYKNQNKAGQWSEYTVTALKENVIFELLSKDKNYHVRYTYRAINAETCELEYFEWVDRGELEEPFTLNTLKKLKSAMGVNRKRLDG